MLREIAFPHHLLVRKIGFDKMVVLVLAIPELRKWVEVWKVLKFKVISGTY